MPTVRPTHGARGHLLQVRPVVNHDPKACSICQDRTPRTRKERACKRARAYYVEELERAKHGVHPKSQHQPKGDPPRKRLKDTTSLAYSPSKKRCHETSSLSRKPALAMSTEFNSCIQGVQPIPSQGGKLEIAGTVVGHWAGTRRGRGRGPFPLQVVSVGGPRGRPRGVISTPVIRTFGRGGKYYGRGYKPQGTGQTKPPYAASAEEVAKELKTQSEDSKSSAVSSDGSLAENGMANDEKTTSQMNGNTADVGASNQSESALNSDSKLCNTNPHLNALNTDSVSHKDETLEAAVLKKEE